MKCVEELEFAVNDSVLLATDCTVTKDAWASVVAVAEAFASAGLVFPATGLAVGHHNGIAVCLVATMDIFRDAPRVASGKGADGPFSFSCGSLLVAVLPSSLGPIGRVAPRFAFRGL